MNKKTLMQEFGITDKEAQELIKEGVIPYGCSLSKNEYRCLGWSDNHHDTGWHSDNGYPSGVN
jgi:hypothetical protein